MTREQWEIETKNHPSIMHTIFAYDKMLTEGKSEVFLDHNNETGEWLWAICYKNDPEFWMESFETKNEAIEFCNHMNWKITN